MSITLEEWNMLKIFQPGPDDGGTRYGSTLYKTSLSCPKKAQYFLDKWEPGVEDFGESGALAVGSYFHKFGEHYHGGTLPEEPIQVSDLGGREAAVEAKRLFDYYSSEISPDFYGEVVGVEVPVTEDHSRWETVCEAVGGVPFTFKCDLVVRVDSAALARLDAGGLLLPGEGLYIVDYKTRGRRDSLAQSKYEVDIQARGYPVGLEAALEEEVQGIIFVEIFKTKQPGHAFFFVPTPRGEALVGLQQTFRNADRMRQTGMANPLVCYDYNRECELKQKGLCYGY